MRLATPEARRHLQQSSRGFTLLEVLVALTILGMAVVVIIQLASANSRAIAKTDAYSCLVLRADATMNEILDRADLTEGQWTERTDDGYTVHYAVEETLADRTEDLPLKMLRIDLSLADTNRTITLRSLKLIKNELTEREKQKGSEKKSSSSK